MDATICLYNHEYKISLQLGLMKLDPGPWSPSLDPQYDSNDVSECLEVEHGRNHLITDQWHEPLTSVRETTTNDNGSQGTPSRIYEVWISDMKLNTHRIIWSKANDENHSSKARNLPLRHAVFKVLKVSKSAS